ASISSGPDSRRAMQGGRIPLPLRVVLATLTATVLFLNVHAEGPPDVGTPQPLAEALEAYAKATGYQLIYRADLTAGLTSSAVPPDTPPAEALRQLLRGTDLDFSFVNSRTIVIWRSPAGSGPSDSASAQPPGNTDAGSAKETHSHVPGGRGQAATRRGPPA